MPSPLDGIRVIDLSMGPVGGMATMVMADFGADVIKVEPPGGDPFRFLANAPIWLRGKRSVVLDLQDEADRARLQRLTGDADVLVATSRPGEAEQLGTDHKTLRAGNPGLVYAHITGFGPRGPFAGYAPHEGIIAARAGRMMSFEGTDPRPGPQFAALQVLSHSAAQAAVTGTVAALLARERIGQGQLVETSLLQALQSYDMYGLSFASLMARDPARWAVAEPPTAPDRLPTVNYQPVMARDGRWIQLGNLLQHLFDNFVASAGLEAIFADERYQGPTGAWAEADREAFRDRMLARMRELDSTEWQRIFVEHGGVVSTLFQTTQEALSDPDLVMNGHVVELPDGRPGTVEVPPTRQPGPIARMTATPASIRSAVPAVGEHQSLLDERRAGWQPPVTSGPEGGALHGITVLDFSTIIAAPLACTHLADLGARVIKVEQLGGDPWRGMGVGSLGFIKTNGGKESICVDLKSPGGQEILRRLVAEADLIVHNFRPGVPERLGMSYSQVAEINPAAVYLTVNGYGPLGPSAHRPATHPVPGAALGGAVWQAGGVPTGTTLPELREGARRLFRANEVNPDPNTTAVIASAALLGLYARRVHGVSQEIFVDMMGANAYANVDDFFWYEGREPRPPVDAGLHGTGPLYRLYEAREGWVFLGLLLDEEWSAFCGLTGQHALASDARFANRAARAEHADALTDALTTLFHTRTADEWEALLAPEGLGCVRADGPLPGDFWHTSEHVAANEFKATVTHSSHGELERHGPVVRMRGTPNRLASAPLAGEHTDVLLQELGFGAEEVARFREAGAIWSEPVVPFSPGVG